MENLSQLERLGLFDAKVPRYTSYPPATKFSNDVTRHVQQDWITAIPAGSQISLYLHVPFCRRLCWFCACRTQGVRSDKPVAAYLQSLKAEITTIARLLPDQVTVARLHWGGGTPTLLSPDQITDLANTVQAMFPMAKGAEFSVEIDPNEIDPPRVEALARAGMNRASIGVQDFDAEIQNTIGRIQTYEITSNAAKALRAAGVASLNMDMLFGLPHQTPERIAQTVQMVLSLSPDRVALYGYAHVPWMAKRQSMILVDTLPSPQTRLGLFETAQKLFMWDGYKQIGIDHFAKPTDGLAIAANTKKLRRNFQGYTDDTCAVLLGLGASAISRFPQGYAQNASGTADYQQAVRAGQLATGRGHVFHGQDRLRARMIEMLMCDNQIDLAEIARDFAPDLPVATQACAQAAAQFGDLIIWQDDRFLVKPTGRPLLRMIARVFDEYDMSSNSHSSAI